MSKYLKYVAPVAMMAVMTACIDDNYDLSDVDTTVKVGVDQLVIPVNIDEISMKQIINLHEDDIVKVVDGNYAIVKNGTFVSDHISIPEIILPAPEIKATEIPITLANVPFSTMADNDATFTYEITSPPSEFKFSSSNVSDMIVSIDYVSCELDLKINVTLDGLQNFVNSLTLSDIVLQLPRGLDLTQTAGGVYDPVTGELKIANVDVNGTSATLNLHASGIDVTQSGTDYDYDKSSLNVEGSLYIKSGKANMTISDIKPGITQLPQQVTLRNTYSLSNARIKTFTGEVRYTIKNASLTTIDLSGVPDILSQTSTNISVVNPQIWLTIDNPLQAYDIYARTGLKIVASRSENSLNYSIDNPWFQIGPGNANGLYNFCLSPKETTNAEFPNATHVPFTSLSNVLSGNGIPTSLQLSLVDPIMPTQKVTNFALGQDLGTLHGIYKFLAPLDFVSGSTVTYIHRIDGWHSEDLDYMTITELEVNLSTSTDLPVGVEFTGYPIDINGNRIEGVDIVGANIMANADGQALTIKVTGTVEGRLLDGIEFVAVATAADGTALNPDMNVKLSNIRPKVTGYYQKKL